MARRATRIQAVHSFVGGLNLRDDAFQLADDELEDCLNVTVLPQGGIERRKSVAPYNASAVGSGELKNLWPFIRSAAAYAVVVQRGDDLAHISQAGTVTDIALADATAGVMNAATMASITGAGGATADVANLYIQRNAEFAPVRLDGTAATVLTVPAFNDDLATPNGDNMPQARYICTHLAYMFVAYTVESGTTFKNRIRWSHPGEPEDWRTNDYIDVGNDEGDVIVGLASVGDLLVIFKSRSIWLLRGYGTDSFSVERLSGDIGATSQQAISVGVRGVAWFDARRGAFQYDGKDILHLWPKLENVIGSADLPLTEIADTAVSWYGDKLYVSTPWSNVAGNARTFVYDPKVGSDGAWYVYAYGVRAMLDFHPTSSARAFVAIPYSNDGELLHEGGTLDTVAYLSAGFLVKLEDALGADDDFGNSVDYPYVAWFYTSWFDANSSTVRKRWRRPYFVLDSTAAGLLNVQVFRDYDRGLGRTREFNLLLDVDSVGGDWGDNWDEFDWAGETSGEQIERGSGLGRAYALQLRVQGRSTVHWRLNAIDFRFIMTRVR